MAYLIVEMPMTLSDRQGHSPIASLFKCNFSYSCAAVVKVSVESASRGPSAIAQPLVQYISKKISCHDWSVAVA